METKVTSLEEPAAIAGDSVEPISGSEAERIVAVRRLWMTKKGFTKEEIEEECNLDEFPGTLDDELAQLAALKEIEELNKQIKWNT